MNYTNLSLVEREVFCLAHGGDELIYGHTGLADDRAQSAAIEFFVIGHDQGAAERCIPEDDVVTLAAVGQDLKAQPF